MSFPNQLSDPKPLRLVLTGAGTRLTFLFLLALAPRVWVAERIDALCGDGVFHIGKAQQLEQGKARSAHDGYDLNTYPLILSAWHRTGLDWEMAAKAWGVLAGSLAVLPLFGWVRRVFDDRVAFVAGALYAVHPKLVEWSPEALRDPTFWLFFATWLYCSWRAITEVHRGWFLAAGCATFLAVQTRFEGWLLLLPLAAWCGWRWLSLAQARWRLVGGMGIGLLCYPLVMVSLGYLHGYQCWELGGPVRVQLLVNWVRTHGGSLATESRTPEINALVQQAAVLDAPAQSHTADGVAPDGDGALSAGSEQREASSAGMARPIMRTGLVLLDKIGRGYTVPFGLLVLLGVLRWWRLFFRPDHLPLVLFAAATLAAIWVHAAATWMSSTRYLMPLVILATPMAALGLFPACRWAARLASWLAPRASLAPAAAAAFVLVLVMGIGCGQAVLRRDLNRAAKAELGAWLAERLGPHAAIAGPINWNLASYYAQAEYYTFPFFTTDFTPEWFGRLLVDRRPDAVVLSQGTLPVGLTRALMQQASDDGFEPIDPERLPVLCRQSVTVLVKASNGVARRHGQCSASAGGISK